MFKELDKSSFYYGFPVTLLTTRDSKTAQDNITPISSTWTLDRTVVLGIGLQQKAYCNLTAGSDLTLNLPDIELLESVKRIANTTGNLDMPDWKKELNYQYCEDKFKLGNFTKLPGLKASSSRIAECPIQLECKTSYITKRESFALIECQIINFVVDEKILHDESHVDIGKWSPLIYKFRSYETTSKSFGKDQRFNEFSRN
ncbi:MAG: flavin reductase [Streptococcaceae bacterium]|jgi:flavin reductase (DIM6/NTAB) family NADH-FMN oxidoreductase RutF|nr:flavin reductase [Streptococcaceae bacterium]